MASKLLVIEDDPDGAASVRDAASDGGFEVLLARTGQEGIALFREHRPALVLTDLVLPDLDGIEVMSRIQQIDRSVPVIVMTAYGTVDSSVRALRAGAYDYIQKPLNLDDLESTLRRAAETSRLRSRVDVMATSLRDKFTARAMVAESDAMRTVIAQIESLADTMATVMIQGESGTGKELVARALHADSRRVKGPFVAVNCGAFAESLLESELFGHEKGSFTGASSQSKGAFERADGGTLFLDEIGDAPLAVQVKLLRALEEREIRRVGGQQAFKVDVRVVSATHRDLNERVAEGLFREDLLYRVNVVNITVPPLRQRPADIRPLATRFIAQACDTHQRRIVHVAESFYRVLERYEWPGNIRQLRNVVEASVLLCSGPELTDQSVSLPAVPPGGGVGLDEFELPEGMTLEQLERAVLRKTLERYQGNRTLTAERLGLSRRTIQRKVKEHGLPF
ncbi:MAG: sigma-54-dependent Fis family transcriptional regulator [Lentisphaerae bacterium]|nr:sigma-54-dependent Fis family transcriptional regulator [Lentisphaerota bacterium]